MPDVSPVYLPRNPQASQYYQCVEDHFETLEQVYDERFAKQYGFAPDLQRLCDPGSDLQENHR